MRRTDARTLAVASLGRGDARELGELFARNDTDAVTRHFDPFPLTPATARRLTSAPGRDRFYAARLDGRLVGFSMLRGWDEGYEVPSLGVLVDRHHQGRGVGGALTAFTCEQARDLGCTRVRLSVYGDNAPARGLYASLGFRESERGPAAGRERIVMELALGRPPPIPVAEPELGGNEAAYVEDCLRTTWISSAGAYVDRFEREFAAFCGTRHAVACCNGTAALHLALLAAGVGPGDEVIVPALSYVACANAVAYCGATPVLADAEPRIWNVDQAAVEAAVSARTRAILAVHLYGHPADVDALRAVADRHGLRLVEDAAEAHGARHRDRPAGSLGDIACFSFYGNKILTTGEGGMVVCDDDEMAAHVRLLRGQGQDPERRYWHVARGFNYRMSNVAAAIGVAQLERAEHHVERRREVNRLYRDALAGVEGVEFPAEAPWARPVHWMTAVRLAGGVDRAAVTDRLAARGIETRPAFVPLHELPVYAGAGAPGQFPVAEELGAQALCLPSSATLRAHDVERVALALALAVRG